MKFNLQSNLSSENLTDLNDNQINSYLERIKHAKEKRKTLELEKSVLLKNCELKSNELQKLKIINKQLKEQLDKSKIGARALKELLQAKEHRVNQDVESSHLRIFSEKHSVNN